MSRIRTRFVQTFRTVAIVIAVITYSRLFNPIASAQYPSTCTPAANPCPTCPSTNNVYQCILAVNPNQTYQWGYCGGPKNKSCWQKYLDCHVTEKWSCANPPVDQMKTCATTDTYSVCSY